jgi:two-component system chemotaxis sensor kinase CheA
VRPVKDPLVNVAGVSGSTDLGDGRPTLVLDLLGLMGRAMGAGSAAS